MNFNLLSLILHWVVSALALAVTAAIVPGFRIRGFTTALIAVVILGVANYTVWPLLVFLTLPLTIVTLGLFLFVVDAIILRLISVFLKDFEISGWISAILAAVILSLTSGILHWLLV